MTFFKSLSASEIVSLDILKKLIEFLLDSTEFEFQKATISCKEKEVFENCPALLMRIRATLVTKKASVPIETTFVLVKKDFWEIRPGDSLYIETKDGRPYTLGCFRAPDTGEFIHTTHAEGLKEFREKML